jgi:predicted enzyme related to lactoylglutathione lyase
MSETITTAKTALTWFEIPTVDFERARRFYETIFEAPLKVVEDIQGRVAVFPHERPGVGGALEEGGKPSSHGTLIYLNADGHFDRTLALVESAGGRIETPKTPLPPGMGWIARIVDTEGNRVGLHTIS